MPLLLDTPRTGAAVELRRANGLDIGLVNNMPDAALAATERQFVALLQAAAADAVVVRLKLFSIPAVPRADHVRQDLAARYRDISELWEARLDGVIVTGTEPRAANLKDEPYWPALARLVDWTRDNTAAAIWSCLAAHAAVLHADGIERQPLAGKRFGIFDCEVAAAHPLIRGAPSRLRVPHSRLNDLPGSALAASGYRLLSRSAAAGVDMFADDRRGASSLFLFLQGHPEYEAGTLLREYRRDIGRFLRGERTHYPAMPQGYFGDRATALANAFRVRACAARRRGRGDDLIADFPMGVLDAGLECTWRRSAVGLYANWIDYLKQRQAQQRPLPAQRPWRRRWPNGGVRAAADGSAAG